MAKSTETLANEMEIKGKIQQAMKDPVPLNFQSMLLNPLAPMFITSLGSGEWALVKDRTDIYHRTYQLGPQTVALYKRIKAGFLTHWGPAGIQLGQSTVTVLGLVKRDFSTGLDKARVNVKIIEGPLSGAVPTKQLVEFIDSMPLTDRAAFMTWPDALGRVKVLAHKDSFMSIAMNKKSTGLRLDKLTTADWPLLVDYLEGRKKIGLPVNQQAVCAIVKAISNRLSVAEINKMISSSQAASSYGY